MGKKIIFLFLALLLPICVFLFLRIFGKNEFRVEPLFQNDKEKIQRDGCETITFPYRIPTEVLKTILPANDSLALICFDLLDEDSKREFPKLKDEFSKDPVHVLITEPGSEAQSSWYKCVFLMTQPADMVLIDARGTIRGQYESSDRDEIDRLKTEVAIILKKY